VEVYICSTVINYDIYFVVALRQSCLHQVQAVILEDCPSVLTVISLLKPRGNFMYRRFCTTKEYKYCIRAYLCVSYDSHDTKKIFPYTAIAGSLYNRDGECLLRGTDKIFIEVRVISPLNRPFRGSGVWSPASKTRGLGSVRRLSIKEMWWNECGNVMGFCLSTSVLPCQ